MTIIEPAAGKPTIWASTGHAAAVYGEELYDILPQTRGGYGRLQDFGIRFGYERVVLHLQPQVEAGVCNATPPGRCCCSTTSRSPWARWGEEFAAAMPAEILRLQERAASAEASLAERRSATASTPILPLYRLSRYRPTRPPTTDGHAAIEGGASDDPADMPAAAPIDGEASGAPDRGWRCVRPSEHR